MEALGADRLATGHYARIDRLPDGRVALRRAADASKDQTYALALVPYASLERAMFPLGELEKPAVRAHAERLGLRVWDKPESQDLCFVPDGDYAGFMTSKLHETRGTVAGPIETADGRRLGTHHGIIRYTVGQRRGLGIAAAERLYVIELDAARNAVVVGERSQLDRPGLETGPVNWLVSPSREPLRADVQVRAHHVAAAAIVQPRPDGTAEVRFEAPQAAITPGQLAVFYDGDRVLGGGPIARPIGSGAAGPRSAASSGRVHPC
jgi:tRNA-specific 2-thiouridylase